MLTGPGSHGSSPWEGGSWPLQSSPGWGGGPPVGWWRGPSSERCTCAASPLHHAASRRGPPPRAGEDFLVPRLVRRLRLGVVADQALGAEHRLDARIAPGVVAVHLRVVLGVAL